MKKKNLILFFSLLLISSTALYLFQYENSKRDKFALNIKRRLNSNNKRKALSWSSLKKTIPKNNTILNSLNPKKETSENNSKTKGFEYFSNLQEKDTSELIQFIESTLKPRTRQNSSDLEKGIKVIDELISRNPNVYSSYKAKLILLLKKESNQGADYQDEVIEDLLETISGFDVKSDYALRKEAFLIAKTNNSLNRLDNEIDLLENELIRSTDQAESDQLSLLITTKLIEMEEEESSLENRLLVEEDYLNEDLVEIPLHRALVKKDYENVIETANAIIENFPDSISGYFFLVKALELSGETELATSVIEQCLLNLEDLRELQLRLMRSKNIDPRDYWKQLRF
jgi:hypothetical protein